ncbi:MAG: DUF4255 domain-containing protein [Bacteroidota bacterium]
MIYYAVKYIAEDLNTYVVNQGLDDDPIKVKISYLMNPDGTNVDVSDQVLVSLFNIEEEKNHPAHQAYRADSDGGYSYQHQPVNLNFYLLFAAMFAEHSEALKYLSLVIAYFQQKPYFDSRNSPGLDSGIEQMTCKIKNTSIHDYSNVWSSVGTKAIPSVLYKVSMLSIFTDATARKVAATTETDIRTQTL